VNTITTIEGSLHSDERGRLIFFNAFKMAEIKRFYEIVPSSTTTIRGWQGHQNEKKWFYCTSGSFIVNLINLKSHNPTVSESNMERFELTATKPLILEVPGGYASGFKANMEESKLIVFSNFDLEESKKDDLRFPIDKWKAEW
jgi:dTDP-4-dehydrorhamnose 3,5-epimerase-like enzyme